MSTRTVARNSRAPNPAPTPVRTGFSNPTARAHFLQGVANARFTTEEVVDGKLVQTERRSTPEGVAWFFDGL